MMTVRKQEENVKEKEKEESNIKKNMITKYIYSGDLRTGSKNSILKMLES